MAEGFARKFGAGVMESYSAGSRPSGKVNETAIQVMAEIGIDLSPHKSKGLDQLPQGTWDYMITMGCGDACPHLPAKNRDDWDLKDPKNLPLDEFRGVRDDIGNRIKSLIDVIKRETSNISG